MKNSALIGDPGKTVEIDEGKFRKRKFNVGGVTESQWMFGGVCRVTKDFFSYPLRKEARTRQ